ncbi:hypothetical protein LCGC14_3081850, partial [marine sediment metagenome]
GTLVARARERAKEKYDQFVIDWGDEAASLEDLSKFIADQGVDLPFKQDAWQLFQSARGVARGRIFIEEMAFTGEGRPIGPSLEELLKPVRKSRDDFARYVLARQALHRASRKEGFNPGATSADLQVEIDEQIAAHPEFEEVHDKLQVWLKQARDWAKERSPSMAPIIDRFEEAGEYLTLRRDIDPKLLPAGVKTRTLGRLSKGGSWAGYLDPIEQTGITVSMMLKMAETKGIQDAVAAMARRPDIRGLGAWVVPIEVPTEIHKEYAQTAVEALQRLGIETADLTDEEKTLVATFFTPATNIDGQPVFTSVNPETGKAEWFLVTKPAVMEALEGLDPVDVRALERFTMD